MAAALLFIQRVPDICWVQGDHWLADGVFALQDNRLAWQEWRDYLAATASAEPDKL